MRTVCSRRGRLPILLIALAAGGCAGNSLPDIEAVAGASPSVHAKGPAPEATCASIKDVLDRRVGEIKRLRGAMTNELKEPPPTMVRLWQRASGQTAESSIAFDKIQTERGAADALNQRLRAKSCATVDIDAASTPDQPKPPKT